MRTIPFPTSFRSLCILGVTAFLFISGFSTPAASQRRDYMNEEEIELVRDNQDIDLRIDVLVKMIDRRFTLLGIDVGGWKEREKDSEKWGAPPQGTRLELAADIRHLLVKAVDDLDVIAQRNSEALKQNKTEGKLFPKAVRSLETAARRYARPLADAADASATEYERGQFLNTLDLCEQIIEAAGRLEAAGDSRTN